MYPLIGWHIHIIDTLPVLMVYVLFLCVMLTCLFYVGGGAFNRLSTLLAHNYLIHFPLKSELVFKEREIEFDIQRLATHVKAFITSLER